MNNLTDEDIDAMVDAADEQHAEKQGQLKEEQMQRLEAFSSTIKGLRKAAIEARLASGIEDQWQEDEDHYEGIDNANRTTASRVKPYDFGGTGTGPTRSPEKNSNRSTIFVPLTRPYVDIAAARISDMYLPTDDRNWDGEPTPVPELINALEDHTPVAPQQAGPDGQPMPQPTVADQARAVMGEATKCWEKARTQIDDWLVECGYNGELRKVVHDMARIGTGILKGPFPKSKVSKAVKKMAGGYAMEVVSQIVPASVRVDPWKFYPAAGCGEDVNECPYVFEEDAITRSKLRDLKAEGLGYIVEQIDACLEEGPIHPLTGTKKTQGNQKSESDLFGIWYFEGQVEWQDLKDAGCDCDGEKGDVFHAVVTMVNDRVVKAALHHLDAGEFTYDVVVWQRKSGMWAGDGVARQGRTAQLGVNAAARNLLDNAGQSAKPHKVINRSAIKPGPDPWTWYMSGDADTQQVAHAMMFFAVPSMQKELMEIIAYFNKMFEDATGLPMLLMGQQGAAPETVGGMEMLQNNAGTVPRNIVRMLDNKLTTPHINRYYEYLLVHGEDDSMKGDFKIHARGSSALVERDAQSQFLINIMQLALNPACEIDPSLFIDELLKSKRINPERLKLTEEKKKAMQQTPPEDPRITAAKIMADTQLKKIQMQGQIDGQLEHFASEDEKQLAALDAHVRREIAGMEQQTRVHVAQVDTDRDTQYVMSQERKDAVAHEMRQQELLVKRELALLEYANRKEISLEEVKVQLAKTAMAEDTKRQLAKAQIALNQNENSKDRAVDVHKHHATLASAPKPPEPIEFPGKAEPGKAFSQ